MQNTRKQKIYPKFRRRTHDTICIPVIRLEGIWLAQLGFTQGAGIEIKEAPGKITIILQEDKNSRTL